MAYSTVDKASLFQNNVLYTGTGGVQTISGVGFEPDFTWCKDRTNSYDHVWFDQVRGATERISSNTTGAESTQVNDLTAWNSDGFVVGSGSNINNNTNLFVSWNWKLGTTSGLTGGTITPSSYSINTTARQGIYKRTGTASAGTITHGLGGTPKMIITKNLSSTSNWRVYHVALGSGNGINLNETAGDYSDANLWNGTDPTSTVYSIGSSNDTNKSGSDFIDYVFCEMSGFSSIGKYTGNGNADGPFVYLGFRPAFLLVKCWSHAEPWLLWDDKRLGYNEKNYRINANEAGGDNTSIEIDLLSNGFKFISSGAHLNGSGRYYLYLAFADFPLVSSNDVPGTAR